MTKQARNQRISGVIVTAIETAIAEACAYSEGHEHSDVFRRIENMLEPGLTEIKRLLAALPAAEARCQQLDALETEMRAAERPREP